MNWTLVLAHDEKVSNAKLDQVKMELDKCYQNQLLIKAADDYEKAFTDLNEEQQQLIKKNYPFDLRITKFQ